MQDAAEKRFQMMTEEPVNKLVLKMALPTIITMMISAVYNMADTFFVGQIGTSATGAVGISFSVMAIIQAIGFMLGMGSGNTIARLLGQKARGDAERVAATGFYTALALGAVMGIIGLIILDPLVHLLGATDTIAPFAKEYLRYILIGAPFMVASFVLNNIFRLQGSAFFGMIGMGIGGILNIGLDPLFIFVFDMGVAGAALATMFSQVVSFCILLFNCGKRGNVGVAPCHFTPKWSIYRPILTGGLPSFYRQGLASLSTIFLNIAANPFGDAAIAAMAIVGRLFHFALSALLGFGQGFQPICGFNFGAKKYDRVLGAFWFCVRTATIMLAIVGAIFYAFAPQIVSQFGKDPKVIEIGVQALRFQCLTFPLAPWVIINNMMLQTIGSTGRASLLSLSRQGLFFVPLILILPHLIGLLGVQISQPISEVLSFLIAFPISLGAIKALKNGTVEQIGLGAS